MSSPTTERVFCLPNAIRSLGAKKRQGGAQLLLRT
jgi:hypothetical protein